MAQVTIKRTSTPNSPPTGLVPGELGVEMADPTRLWVGVPTALDATGKKLLFDSSSIEGVVIAETPPLNATPGMLWYESDTGILWLYYDDGTSVQWVQVNGASGGGGGGVSVGDTPPPTPKQGDLWYESDTSIFWLYYDDGNSQQWVQMNGASSGGAAPVDAYTKAESDANFVNVTGDTMTGGLTINGETNVNSAPLKVNHNTASAEIYLNTIAGQANYIHGMKGAGPRWRLDLGDSIPETAIDDTGSNFAIHRYGTNGVYINSPLDIQRASGTVGLNDVRLGFKNSVAIWSYEIEASTTSWNFWSSTVAGQYMTPNGTSWAAMSDARFAYKISAVPFADTLDRLTGVQLYHNVTPSGKDEVFFKAQELATTLPELVVEGTGDKALDANYAPTGLGDINAWGITYDRCGAVALQAVKELLALNQALEARIAALEGTR